jgi:ABC-2 type transport system ATP-binding protein
MNYVIETCQVTRAFGRFEAVSGINLAIRHGETYGLLGPNGAGKTTLIRLLVGLLRPTGGHVTVLGHTMPDKRVLAEVGYMTQARAIYTDLSLRENVAFFGAMAGQRDPQRVDEVIALVDLSDWADARVARLSSGMQQRASLACALVHRPRLLLLDEPTVGVDPHLRVQFWEYFRHLNAAGVSIVVSSHVMDEAERCDRLGFIRAGKLLAEGSPAELRSRAGAKTLEEAFLWLSTSAGAAGGDPRPAVTREEA